MSKKEWVEAQIKADKVVVFSKTYCPYCKMAKEALTNTGLKNFLVFELDERDDGDEIQDILLGITGARSVPRVFLDGKFLGGGTAIKDLQSSGQLVPKLKDVGAL